MGFARDEFYIIYVIINQCFLYIIFDIDMKIFVKDLKKNAVF